MFKKLILLLVGVVVCAFGEQDSPAQMLFAQEALYPNFTNNSILNDDIKESVYPYLLPLDHPIKQVLDAIFTSAEVVDSEDSLREAGFTIAFSQKRTLIRVIKHPEFPGYLIKLFPNMEKGMLSSGWKRLRIRCLVAREIGEIIKRKNLLHFEVAEKWLYPLPSDPTGRKTQPLVLLVKDMDIVNWQESKRAWGKCVDKSVFDELYQILGQGQGSTFLPGNIPFTRHDTFAFVDTEFGQRKMQLSRIYRYISIPMRTYWRVLMASHPPLD